MIKSISIAGIALIIVLTSSVTYAGYIVTNPVDIWVGGNSANGKDIIDPPGNANIDVEYGNISSSTLNSIARRYVFGMDTSEFATGAGNIPDSFILTKAVSGMDLIITMGTGVQFLQSYTLGNATSSSNSLATSIFSFHNLKFDHPMESAGFCITQIGQPDITVYFYSDTAGTQLLASYTILDSDDPTLPADTPDRYTAFVGHTDTSVGIRNISMLRGTSTGGSVLIDDIVVVTSPRGTLLIIN